MTQRLSDEQVSEFAAAGSQLALDLQAARADNANREDLIAGLQREIVRLGADNARLCAELEREREVIQPKLDATITRQRHAHDFTELPSAQARGGYFKQLPDGSYDQTIAYTMLYCRECGETKEVVAADLQEARADNARLRAELQPYLDAVELAKVSGKDFAAALTETYKLRAESAERQLEECRELLDQIQREAARRHDISWELSNNGADEYRRGEARVAGELARFIIDRRSRGSSGGHRYSEGGRTKQ